MTGGCTTKVTVPHRRRSPVSTVHHGDHAEGKKYENQLQQKDKSLPCYADREEENGKQGLHGNVYLWGWCVP